MPVRIQTEGREEVKAVRKSNREKGSEKEDRVGEKKGPQRTRR